jgi:SAM-dependent methyltransferase
MSDDLGKTISSDRIQDTLYGFMQTQILISAIELDIFTQIAKGFNTLTLLREKLELSRRGTRILLNGLVGIGFLLHSEDGIYSLPSDANEFLVQGKAQYLGGMVHHVRELYENWSQLSGSVRNGQPAGGAQTLAQVEAYFAELVKGLYVSNYPSAKGLARFLASQDKAAPKKILDIAGGSGVWSIALLEQFPEAEGTLLDYESVLPVAKEAIASHQLSSRYNLIAGDLEELDLPDASFDCVILANICHLIGPVSTRKTFHLLAKILQPGGRLIIVDFMPDRLRSMPGWPLVFGVNMLITTGEGDVFTAHEYETWLQASGLSSPIRYELEKDVTALIVQK